MASPYVVDYRGRFNLPLAPGEAWAYLQETHLYERWWPWMRDLVVEGGGIEEGTSFSFRVVSPLPYRMRLKVEVLEAGPLRASAAITGDLDGTGDLEISAAPDGSVVALHWDVEIKHGQMRIAARLARPLLRWGQTWAIESALRGFLRHVMGARSD